jgi:hypothetical protein
MSQPAISSRQSSIFEVSTTPHAVSSEEPSLLQSVAPNYTSSISSTKMKPYVTKPLAPVPSFQAVPHTWELSPAEREEVSHSITQTWTDQAIKCYMTGANCQRCDIPRGAYSFVCQMDKVVPVLLDTLGKPDTHRLKRVYPQGFSVEQYQADDPAVLPACLR